MVVRELITLLGFDLQDGPLKKYDSQIDQTKQKSNGLATAARGVGTAYKWAAAAAAVGVGFLTKHIIDVSAQTEQYRVALGTMIGDQEKANKLIHDLDYSPLSDFYGTAAAIGGLQGMVTFGMQAEEASDVLTRLGDIAQGDSEAFVSMSNNMGQIFAKGKADATDLKQFAMRGFDVVGVIAAQTGKTREAIQKQGVSYAQTAAALKELTNEGGKYYGMMAKNMNTMTGILKQFKSWWAATGEAIGFSVIEPLKDVLKYVLEIARSMSDSIVSAGSKAFKFLLHLIAQVIIFFQVLQMRMRKYGGAFTALKALFQDVFGFLMDVIRSAQPLLMNLAIMFLAAFRPIQAFVKPVLEALKPIFAEVFGYLADLVAGLIPIINGLTPVFKVLGVIVGVLVSVFASGGMTIIKALTPIAGIILALIGAIKIWTAVQWLLNIALNANPIGLIILAVVALIGAIVLLVKHFDKVKAFFMMIGTAIANFFKKIVRFIKDNAVNIVNIVLTILFPIAGIIMALVRLIIKHWDAIKGAVAGVVENIKAVFFSMVEAVKGAWQGFVDFFSSLFSWIGDMASGVWNRIRESFVSVFENIKEKFFGFINVIKDGWEKAKGLLGGVVNFFTGGNGNERNANTSGGGNGGGGSAMAASQPFVQTAAASAAASAAARNTYNTGGATQTINSTASISVNVPPGTSTEQAQAISRQVDQAMKNSLANAINGSRGTIPSPEARRY